MEQRISPCSHQYNEDKTDIFYQWKYIATSRISKPQNYNACNKLTTITQCTHICEQLLIIKYGIISLSTVITV